MQSIESSHDYQRNTSITEPCRALTPSYDAGSMSQFWGAEKLPSSFPVLFFLIRNTLASESEMPTDLENSFLVWWIQSPACSLGPEFYPSATEFQHWDSNNPFLPLSSFLSLSPPLFFLNYFRYRHADALGHAASQEYSEHQHRAPSKARLPKEQKNTEASLRPPRASWLYSRMAEKHGQAW